MTETQQAIQCDTHGSNAGAYICQHLSSGKRRGFHSGLDPQQPYALCPDAWCDDCDAALVAAGSWTEAASAQAGITLVCAECYLDIRTANWIEDSEAFEALGVEYTRALGTSQDALWRTYGIERLERWDWSLETAQLVFSHGEEAKVIADIEFVGSYSTQSATWMWAWGNSAFPDTTRQALTVVRDFGQTRSFMKLATGYWHADENDGPLMTAFAAHLLGGVGGYRTPNNNGYTYMIILDARWAT